jgi:hypothetical protein
MANNIRLATVEKVSPTSRVQIDNEHNCFNSPHLRHTATMMFSVINLQRETVDNRKNPRETSKKCKKREEKLTGKENWDLGK